MSRNQNKRILLYSDGRAFNNRRFGFWNLCERPRELLPRPEQWLLGERLFRLCHPLFLLPLLYVRRILLLTTLQSVYLATHGIIVPPVNWHLYFAAVLA